MADARDLKSLSRKGMWVRVPSPVPSKIYHMRLGSINGYLNSILEIPAKARDLLVDLANQIEVYKIKPFLDEDDLKGAVRKIAEHDSDEAAIDFLRKYLNINGNPTNETEAVRLFYSFTE